MTLNEAEKLLDAGKLQMRRPWGDWVPIQRRGRSLFTGCRGSRIVNIRYWADSQGVV